MLTTKVTFELPKANSKTIKRAQKTHISKNEFVKDKNFFFKPLFLKKRIKKTKSKEYFKIE